MIPSYGSPHSGHHGPIKGLLSFGVRPSFFFESVLLSESIDISTDLTLQPEFPEAFVPRMPGAPRRIPPLYPAHEKAVRISAFKRKALVWGHRFRSVEHVDMVSEIASGIQSLSFSGVSTTSSS